MIGIVASRIAERHHRPAVLIALDGEEGTGSGRSIPAFDLLAGLEAASADLLRHGGHRAAAGLTIERGAGGGVPRRVRRPRGRRPATGGSRAAPARRRRRPRRRAAHRPRRGARAARAVRDGQPGAVPARPERAAGRPAAAGRGPPRRVQPSPRAARARAASPSGAAAPCPRLRPRRSTPPSAWRSTATTARSSRGWSCATPARRRRRPPIAMRGRAAASPTALPSRQLEPAAGAGGPRRRRPGGAGHGRRPRGLRPPRRRHRGAARRSVGRRRAGARGRRPTPSAARGRCSDRVGGLRGDELGGARGRSALAAEHMRTSSRSTRPRPRPLRALAGRLPGAGWIAPRVGRAGARVRAPRARLGARPAPRQAVYRALLAAPARGEPLRVLRGAAAPSRPGRSPAVLRCSRSWPSWSAGAAAAACRAPRTSSSARCVRASSAGWPRLARWHRRREARSRLDRCRAGPARALSGDLERCARRSRGRSGGAALDRRASRNSGSAPRAADGRSPPRRRDTARGGAVRARRSTHGRTARGRWAGAPG